MIPEHVSGTPAEALELDSGVALLSEMVAESGPVESMQLAAWILSACVALVVVLRRRRARERLFAGWLGLVSLLVAFREIDGHVLLNPETLGYWGVRYRIDWWLSTDAPALPRLLWAIAAVSLIAGLIVPAIKVAPRWLVLTRGLDRAWWLFGLSVGALFVGYACDDLIGRGLLIDPVYTKIIEESFELIGAAVFLVAVALMLRLSLTTRENLAETRLQKA